MVPAPEPAGRPGLAREAVRFLLAVQFLTRLPVPASLPWSEAEMQASARYFPAVGALVGVIVAGVWWGASMFWPPTVAVLLAMAAGLALTGAFHEDGWADTCDALGGAVSREKALAIMKDSRLGTYGVAGLVMMLAMKAACLLALPTHSLPAWIVFTQAASRLAPLLLMRSLRYAGDLEHAKAKPLATHASATTLTVAFVTVLGLTAALTSRTAWTPAWALPPVALAVAVAVAAALLATVLFGLWLRRRLGGYTGDTLGASQQLTELTMLLAALVQGGVAHSPG